MIIRSIVVGANLVLVLYYLVALWRAESDNSLFAAGVPLTLLFEGAVAGFFIPLRWFWVALGLFIPTWLVLDWLASWLSATIRKPRAFRLPSFLPRPRP